MSEIYDSGWHHPFVAYVAAFGLVAFIARRLPFLYAYLLVFIVEILADACVTGAWSPVATGTPLYSMLSIVFVVLGDLRFFLLAERVTQPVRAWSRVFLFAASVSLLIPVLTGAFSKVTSLFDNTRVLFLVYEIALVLLVAGFARFRFLPNAADDASRAWIRRVSILFGTLYAGWACCDVLILLGVQWAHTMRVLPNVLYYGAFLPFVFFTAPPGFKHVELVRSEPA